MRPLWIVPALAAACAGDTVPAEIDLVAQPSSLPVSWLGVVNATRSGNDLTKTGTSNEWDAGAISSGKMASDGYVEFTTAESTTAKAAGLSYQNDGASLADIDFAIQLRSDGTVGVREAGTPRGGDLATYVAGDVFRVQVVASVVTYWKNGALLYTSAVAPTFPLRVDCSLRTPGATIIDALVEPAPFWKAVVGARADGGDLVKVDSARLWNAGGASIASLATDGYAEFTSGEVTTAKTVGLSNGDAGQSWEEIDFAIFLKADGTIAVRENGVRRGTSFGTYSPGDRFRIAVTGGVVTYAHNDAVFYTSSQAPSFPLLLDASLRAEGATVLDAELVATGGIATFDNSDGTFVWQESIDCEGSTGGAPLDVTLSAAEQSGVPADHSFFFLKMCAQDLTTPGGFWLTGRGAHSSGEPTDAVLAAGERLLIDGDRPIYPLPPLVKSPGDVVGRADVWSAEIQRTAWPIGVQTAHFQDASGETGPSQVWFMSGIVGLRFNLADGPHYGFVELAWVDNGSLWASDHAPVRWGYNPTPGVGMVIPP